MSFLDERHFDIQATDAKELLLLLGEHYPRDDFVEGFVAEAGLRLDRVNFQQPMADVWLFVLQYAAREGVLRRLVGLVAAHPLGTQVKAFLARQGSAPPPAPASDPFHACILSGQRPMIDRDPLRRRLRELANDHGWRVFVVTGDKKAGKSHSWFLISHISDRLGFECTRVNLASWSGPRMTPIDVIQLAAAELGWAAPAVDTTAQQETQLRILLAWFKRQAKALPAPLWLVFDAVDGKTLSVAGRRLVTEIANAAGNAEAGPLRVVLLGFNGKLDGTVDALAQRLQLPYLIVDDLRSFFADLGRDRGYTLDDAGLDVLVADALGDLSRFDPMRLDEIAARAARAAAAVLPEQVPSGG